MLVSFVLIFIDLKKKKKYASRFFSMENNIFAISDFHFKENPRFRDEFQALKRERLSLV